MAGYQRILVALDVFSEYDEVLQKALFIAGNPSHVSLIYVAYPQANFEPYGLFLERDYSAEVREQATKKLKGVAQGHNIPSTHVHVEIGNPADEIHRKAESLNADLIVVGTHGQSGLELLLGSTANSVLHGVKRDVLSVKL